MKYLLLLFFLSSSALFPALPLALTRGVAGEIEKSPKLQSYLKVAFLLAQNIDFSDRSKLTEMVEQINEAVDNVLNDIKNAKADEEKKISYAIFYQCAAGGYSITNFLSIYELLKSDLKNTSKIKIKPIKFAEPIKKIIGPALEVEMNDFTLIFEKNIKNYLINEKNITQKNLNDFLNVLMHYIYFQLPYFWAGGTSESAKLNVLEELKKDLENADLQNTKLYRDIQQQVEMPSKPSEILKEEISVNLNEKLINLYRDLNALHHALS